MEKDQSKTMSRKWFLTINNYSLEEQEYVKDYTALYIVSGLEECPTTGTPHLHCYFRLRDPKSFKKIKKEFPRANIQVANGNDIQNRNYCLKGGQILIEQGELSRQGARNDLSNIREMIQEEPSMRSMIGNLSNLQGIRTAEKLLTYLEPGRNWLTKVFWYYGSTGTGKSRKAFEDYPNAYVAMDSGRWWEGYDGHSEVIIDDMREDFCSYKQLLRLTDRYELRVETKGGSRQFRAKTIVITSCYSPQQMYSNYLEDLGQLLRRITQIVEFPLIEKNKITSYNINAEDFFKKQS